MCHNCYGKFLLQKHITENPDLFPAMLSALQAANSGN